MKRRNPILGNLFGVPNAFNTLILVLVSNALMPAYTLTLRFTALSRVRPLEIPPQRIVDDDCPAVGEGFDRMPDITRHDGGPACSGDLRYAVNGHLEFALDHLPDLFLGMEVLVNGRATREIIVRECHAGRMEVASIPARQALNDIEAAGINKRQRNLREEL